ncbi:MAG: transglutaminase [Novosphingobium sp.]|nr:transglutaminase [Novosphingobium sp.]
MSAISQRLKIVATLDYTLAEPAPVLMQIGIAGLNDQQVLTETLDLGGLPGAIHVAAHNGLGERSWLMPQDSLMVRYEAEVAISRQALPLASLAADDLPTLPADVIEYLLPSRYCPVDTLHAAAVEMFDNLTGGAAVEAVRDWIGSHLSYVAGASHAGTTALDTFHSREGVCRDYAHLLVALVRGIGVPARVVSAYAPGVTPPDFHALAQVWLAGAWHLVDATGMADPAQTAIIGVGRDAADISFLTIFGSAALNAQGVSVELI